MRTRRSMPLFLRLRESIRTGLWVVPTLFVLGAVGLWLGLRTVDDAELVRSLPLGFDGGPDAARGVLSAISASMITFTGLVFSVTIIALQLASSQFSPRILRNFLRDRRTQAALGAFIATFVYSLLVLRGVRSPGVQEDGFVPRLSVSVAFLFLALSLVMFVVYIHQISQSIRASRIVSGIGHETRATLDHLLAEEPEPPRPWFDLKAPIEVVLEAHEPGTVLGFDASSLVEQARECGTCFHAIARPGDFVPTGSPLVVAAPPSRNGIDEGALRRAVPLGTDRTMQQDVLFGVRQLVDIALRALSPGVNDPTTAVQCLDQIHDLLRRIAPEPLRTGVHHDDHGTLRFVEREQTWDGILDLALTEIRIAGEDQLQVTRRLCALLDDLHAIAPPERQDAIIEHRRALRVTSPGDGEAARRGRERAYSHLTWVADTTTVLVERREPGEGDGG